MKPDRDLELMQHADGESDHDAERTLDATERAKVDALAELAELVRGRLERAADDVPEARFAALWTQIDRGIDRNAQAKLVEPARDPASASSGMWHRLGRWFEQYRGYVLTGAVSAGAVAALALVLRSSGTPVTSAAGAIPTTPVVARPGATNVEELDTPGGDGSVFNLQDEDGSTTVIWVTPKDKVEGL